MAMERHEIDARYKWDLSVIYKDEAAFYADYEQVEKLIEAYPQHEKTMCESAEGLYRALTDMVAIESGSKSCGATLR